jgi:mRNA interferase MazF
VVIRRGGIYWVDLGEPVGSRPAKRRPVIVVQSEPYNASRLATVVAAVITSNTVATELPRDSVVNATALVTLNKNEIEGPVGRVPDELMCEIDRGLRRVLGR